MNPRSIHLDLEELLSDINGDAVSERVWAHLATCGSCRAEARRWETVADGVRGLVATTPEIALPSLPRRTRLAALTGRGRRAMLAAGAAAALLLAGGGYGLTTAFGHAASPAGTGTKTAALTAVKGCARLVQAYGTLEQVTGTSLVIKTTSGQPGAWNRRGREHRRLHRSHVHRNQGPGDHVERNRGRLVQSQPEPAADRREHHRRRLCQAAR